MKPWHTVLKFAWNTGAEEACNTNIMYRVDTWSGDPRFHVGRLTDGLIVRKIRAILQTTDFKWRHTRQ